MLAIPMTRDKASELNIRQYQDTHPPRRQTLSPEGRWFQYSRICDCQLCSRKLDPVLRLDKTVTLVSIVYLILRAK